MHVHVSVEAGVGSAFIGMTDRRARSLGSVRWYGRRGRLVLNQPYPQGGPWGGHLVFSFTAERVNYAISLHSWMAAIRLQGKGVDRVFRVQPGPALPHVIATLKAIVGSALCCRRPG
jgi:hypothetical protein